MRVGRKTLIIALLLAFVIGSVAGDMGTKPKPLADRPFLQLLGKAARLGLWFLAFAEPAPIEHQHVGAIEGEIDHFRSL
jgi:hypothetical protein